MKSKQNLSPEKFPAKIYATNVLSHNFDDGLRYFLQPLMHIHYAHCLMLAKQNIITKNEAKKILKALDQLDLKKINEAKYDGSVEDLYFYIERELGNAIGEEIAGKLHIARSRNDIDITLYRMTLRDEILELIEELMNLRATLISLATTHLRTVMPAHTHTQPAQPTTLAHYLCAAIEFISRDIYRLRNAFRTVNNNPLGACAITTTGFPIDRMMTTKLLGFEGILENSYGCIGGIDYITETVSAVATSCISLGKFTQDLLLWAMQEFSYIRLGDGYVQTSSIMPQKRNPVALEHTRIILSKAYSQAVAVMMTAHNTPFGDIVDSEDDLQPLVFNTFVDAKRAVGLLAGALSSVTVDVEGLRRKAAGSFLTMTELADTLVREEKLSFKMAHRLVALTGKRLTSLETPHAEIIDNLLVVAEEVLGKALSTKRGKLESALCPMNFVEVRHVIGGPAPKQVMKALTSQNKLTKKDQDWVKLQTALISGFPALIKQQRNRLGNQNM